MLGRRLLQFEPQDKPQTLNDTIAFVEPSQEALDSCRASAIHLFSGVEEAHHQLQSIIQATFSSVHLFASHGWPDEIERSLDRGRTLLHDWSATFGRSFAQPSNSRETLLPRILCQSALLIIQTVMSTRHLPSDEDFARQIDSCEAFMQLHNAVDNEGGAFFVDHAVIPGLFFAAVQCKDALLSERAVQTLRSRPWREGFWDSRDVANEAKRVRKLLSEQSLQIEGLREHPFLGCAWEFLGGSGLILSGGDTAITIPLTSPCFERGILST